MTLNDAVDWAIENGYESAYETTMPDGRTVYTLFTRSAVGLPRYLIPTEFGFILSDDDESMDILDEVRDA